MAIHSTFTPIREVIGVFTDTLCVSVILPHERNTLSAILQFLSELSDLLVISNLNPEIMEDDDVYVISYMDRERLYYITAFKNVEICSISVTEWHGRFTETHFFDYNDYIDYMLEIYPLREPNEPDEDYYEEVEYKSDPSHPF